MFRASTDADRESIYQLICELEEQKLPYEAFAAIYAWQCNNPAYSGIVYEDSNGISAFLNLRFEPQLHHAGLICEVMELVVSPALRNRGIGARLLAEADRLAQKRGCLQLELSCGQQRTSAHRFYRRNGMQQRSLKFGKVLDCSAMI